MTEGHRNSGNAIRRFFGSGTLLTRKLVLVIGLFATIVLCLFVLDRFQAYVIDSVRAYVAGEGYWSKGQKDAIYHLIRYATSLDESEYIKYEQGLMAPLGDRKARQALQSDSPDLEAARQGFLQGRNHPDDIDDMVSFFLYFHNVGDMKKAIAIWTEADGLIAQLQLAGRQLHGAIRSGNVDPGRIRQAMLRLDTINEDLRELEDRFSATLGNAARKIESLTGTVMFASTLLLLLIGILLSRQILRSMQAAQGALEESEARFRHVVESNMIGIMFWKADGTMTDANDAFLEIIGYSHEDLASGLNWRGITPPEGQAGDEQALDEVRRKGFCHPFEKEFLHKDGHRVSVYLGAAGFGGAGDGGVCFAIDISERKLAEQAQRLAATVFHAASEAIVVTDTSPRIKAANPAYTRITGYSEAEVLGKNPNILSSGEHDKAFYRAMWKELADEGSWKGEILNRRKDGEVYQAWLSITAVCDEKGGVTEYVGVFSDITELRRMEEHLKQAQKMEAIGTLVGGIAHDFNNTLAAMQGNLYLARQFAGDKPEVAEKLATIEQLGSHSAEIVRQLLAFARKGFVQMKPVSLPAFLGELESSSRVIIPADVELSMQVCDTGLTVSGDATQLQQVMLNLLNNARDAVEACEQPSICIRLECFQPDKAFSETHPELPSGPLAHLCVSDNGCGIAEADMPHIFEPFFTTKEVGKGTGLGMSMVYGLMQSHHGVIEVDSQVGEGTSVHLYLPVVEAAGKTPKVDTGSRANGTPDGRRLTVLLVDDNLDVRSACSEVLHSLGYDVLSEDDGVSAVACFQRQQSGIDLVMTDVVMPVLDGFAVAERIREMRPELPVIFMTGYDPERTVIPEHLEKHSAILTKPFTIQTLVQTVEELLGSA